MNDNIISTYTRQDAIEDGIFVDVSESAKQNGFIIPVALTTNLFNTHIKRDTEQQTNHRLNVFLLIMWQEISARKHRKDTLLTDIKIHFNDKTPTSVWVALEAQSPTDPSPALNFLLPDDY